MKRNKINTAEQTENAMHCSIFVIFQFFSASDFDSFQYYKATFGGRVTFKGMPSADRNGNIAYFNGGMAMTTSCKNKDGAWQFLRRLISDEMQEISGISRSCKSSLTKNSPRQ